MSDTVPARDSNGSHDVEVTTLDLLRHGACADDCHLRGHTDSILSEAGWLQMLQATSQWHQAPCWQAVLTSPLQRCRVFAEQYATQRQLPCYTLEPLQEMNFGRWDGLSLAELHTQFGEEYMAFWQAPDQHTPPEGESLPGFHQRVERTLQQMVRLHRGQHALIATHGGVIRAVIGTILQLPLSHLNRLQIGYGSITQIQVFHHPDHADWFQLNQLQPLTPVQL